MNRSKRVIEALGANYLAQVLRTIISLCVTPFFLNYLGGELMGFRSFVRGILNYLQFADVGVKGSVAALVAKEFQPNTSPSQKFIKLLRAGGQINILFSLIVFLSTIILAVFIKSFSEGLSQENVIMAQWCTVVYGCSFALSIASGVYSGMLIGKQLIAQNTLYSLMQFLIASGIGVYLVYSGWSLYGVALASLVSTVILFAQLRWRTSKMDVRLRLHCPPIESDSMPRLLKLSGWILLGTIGGMLSLQSSQLIMGVTPGLGMSTVNKWALLITVPLAIQLQSNRLSTIFRPSLTQLYYSNMDSTKVRDLVLLLLQIMTLISTTAFVLIWLVNGPFIIRWVGEQYYAGDEANFLAGILFPLLIWRFGYTIFLHIRFQFRRSGIASFMSGVASLILALLLIKPFGISGAFIAGIIAELVINVPFITMHVLKNIPGPHSPFAVFLKIHWLPFILLAFWLVLGLNLSYRPSSWLELATTASLIGSISLLLGAIWLWKDLRLYGPFRRLHLWLATSPFAKS